jgi:Tetracyclin repressor-like, C-terminal domain
MTLLTELVEDAYRDLAAALDRAVARATTDRVRAFAHAYRTWAVAEPHRYRLLFAPPLPGYDAHAERLVDAAQPATTTLLGLLAETGNAGADGSLAEQLNDWTRRRGVDVPAAVALRGVLAWSRLHGLVSLELAGNSASMGLDPERLLEAELAELADHAG